MIDDYESVPQDLLFRYTVATAFITSQMTISVYDRDGENVECQRWSMHADPLDDRTELFSVDRAGLGKISEILRDNAGIFDITDVENTSVCDGVSNTFVFQTDGRVSNIWGSNMWIFKRKDAEEYIQGREKADLVLKVFHKIRKVLISNGVDSKYLALIL